MDNTFVYSVLELMKNSKSIMYLLNKIQNTLNFYSKYKKLKCKTKYKTPFHNDVYSYFLYFYF